MLQDSTDWLDAKRGAEQVIKLASDRLDSWQGITYTVDDVKRQNAELKVHNSVTIYSKLVSPLSLVCLSHLH